MSELKRPKTGCPICDSGSTVSHGCISHEIAPGIVAWFYPYTEPKPATTWTATPSELGAKDRPTGEGIGISQRKLGHGTVEDLVSDVLANPGGYPRTTRRLANHIAKRATKPDPQASWVGADRHNRAGEGKE